MPTQIIIPRDSDLRKEYPAIVNAVQLYGDEIAPRGEPTRELLDFQLHAESLHQITFLNGIGRGASVSILAAEMLQWMSGVSDLKQLGQVSPVFHRFADPDCPDRLYGAYGPRARDGLDRAVDLLAEDNETRQAVASIWNNDERSDTKDLPCTLSWAFNIRNGKLNMTVNMRSNDAWTGLTYDAPAMARIGSAIAWCLGVEVGTYTHNAVSFHLYERDAVHIPKLTAPDDDVVDPPFFDKLLVGDDLGEVEPFMRWDLVKHYAIKALSGQPSVNSFDYYARLMDGTERSRFTCPACGYRTDTRCYHIS